MAGEILLMAKLSDHFMREALWNTFKRLDPRYLKKHPVMFVVFCRVDEDVSILIPHRPERAQFTHSVLHDAASLDLAY